MKHQIDANLPEEWPCGNHSGLAEELALRTVVDAIDLIRMVGAVVVSITPERIRDAPRNSSHHRKINRWYQ